MAPNGIDFEDLDYAPSKPESDLDGWRYGKLGPLELMDHRKVVEPAAIWRKFVFWRSRKGMLKNELEDI